jgi:3-phosphoshikimate 1-carboxyvinyltransferase
LSRDGITVTGLDSASAQGDRAVLEILSRFGAQVTETARGITVRRGPLRAITVDAAPIPDLIPPLAVIAAAAAGETHIIHAGRLRLKESDRLRATADLLTTLGADVTELPEGLIIRGGKPLTGGTVSSWGDHRIAMSAALAASLCTGPVEICDSQCTEKSYPAFWRDLASLKGVEP